MNLHVVTCSALHCSSYDRLALFQQVHWLPIEYPINFKIVHITFRTLYFSQPTCPHSALSADHSAWSLRLSSTISVYRLSRTLSGACTFSVAAPETLFLQLSECILAWHFPSSPQRLRPAITSRHSNLLSAFLLVSQIRLLLTVMCVHKLYLFTYYFFISTCLLGYVRARVLLKTSVDLLLVWIVFIDR